MTTYPKRLIEVDLPIARISAHARREKSIRHGHISTLHIWWARRPLAACRAVICAALWPDPADELCPPAFAVAAARELTAFARRFFPGRITAEEKRLHETAAPESRARWEVIAAIKPIPPAADGEEPLWCAEGDPRLPLVLRGALLDFIADFADWDNSTAPAYLAAARALTQAAHESLGGEPGTRPLVVDPFAGGGSIPLEALRVGADAFASDLNPVAVLLNKVVLEYIPKYGQRLADEVQRRGNQIQTRAEAEIGKFYPTGPGNNVPLAYVWARTVISESPDAGEYPVEIPLLRSLWLAKASGQDRAIKWVRDVKGKVICDAENVVYADGKSLRVLRPRLEIFTPLKGDSVEPGTAARGSATCPVTGFTTPVASVRRQLNARRGGANDARLIAVRQSNPETNDRTYRLPSRSDLEAVASATKRLSERNAVQHGLAESSPFEPLPPKGSLGFRVQLYGMLKWCDLFTPRQLLALTTISQSISSLSEEIERENEPGFALAVQSCLALALGRMADFSSSLCTLNATGNRGCKNTFTRQAVSMIWDFVETAPLNKVGANWLGGIDALESTIQLQKCNERPGTSQQSSATHQLLPDWMAAALVTDPPYYDAVPYSDLADYFFVWIKRALTQQVGFDEQLCPKELECIVDKQKGKDKAYFEATMTLAMAEGRRVLGDFGIGIVVFAHKSTSGWEAQLQALMDAGWTITGSWPIDTERPGRLRAQDSAALASSVHLVCRPRTTDETGDWRDVLAELPRRMHEWMPRLAREGVVGADAIFACLGPALEIFSRYARVERADGTPVGLREYLEFVWGAVSKEALSTIFRDAEAAGLEPDARLTAMWLWTLGGGKSLPASEGADDEAEAEDDDEETSPAAKSGKGSAGGFGLEFDAARKIAQGLGVDLEKHESLVEIKGSKARLLAVAERARRLFGKPGGTSAPAGKPARGAEPKQLSLFAEVDRLTERSPGKPASGGSEATVAPTPGGTVLDRLHQAMLLFGAQRGELLKRFLVDEGVGQDARFWKLAQSLAALYPVGTDERRWVEGVLARKKGLGL